MDVKHQFLLLLSLLVLLLLQSHQTSGAEHVPERCLLDDDQTTVELETCLEKGEEFIESLLDQIKTGNGRRRQNYDVCLSFSYFKDCIEPILHTCSEVRHKLKDNWKLIYDVLNCACNGTASCKNSLDCFVEQFKSTLGRQCDAVYRFNAKQGTNDRCHFLYENVRCKEALVESACSPEAGVFAFHVAKVANRMHIRKHRCIITRDREYHGFRYDERCPANLTAVLDVCEEEHLSTKIKFRRDFDLITNSGKKGLRRACKEYSDYEACVRPLNEACGHGVTKVYDYVGELRRYLLKLQYICNDGKTGYMTNLKCYRDLLDSDTLAQCNHVWLKLSPMLNELNAHGFYCLPESNKTKLVQETLVEIRTCYKNVFDESCGDGGEVIGKLMAKVFSDPVYLRYRFRPDCNLHSARPFATSGPTLSTEKSFITSKPSKPGRNKQNRNKNNQQNQGKDPTSSASEVRGGQARCSSSLTSLTFSLILTLTLWRHLKS